jgi:hypothetical protein
MRADQSIIDYRLSKHIDESTKSPAVELRFETSDSSFAVRDLHPNAAAAWREFVSGLMSEQENEGASLRQSGWSCGTSCRSRARHAVYLLEFLCDGLAELRAELRDK